MDKIQCMTEFKTNFLLPIFWELEWILFYLATTKVRLSYL